MRALFTVERHSGRGDYEDPDRRQAPERERPSADLLEHASPDSAAEREHRGGQLNRLQDLTTGQHLGVRVASTPVSGRLQGNVRKPAANSWEQESLPLDRLHATPVAVVTDRTLRMVTTPRACLPVLVAR